MGFVMSEMCLSVAVGELVNSRLGRRLDSKSIIPPSPRALYNPAHLLKNLFPYARSVSSVVLAFARVQLMDFTAPSLET